MKTKPKTESSLRQLIREVVAAEFAIQNAALVLLHAYGTFSDQQLASYQSILRERLYRNESALEAAYAPSKKGLETTYAPGY